MDPTLLSPKQGKPSAKSKSLAKQVKCSGGKKDATAKNRSKLTTLKSTSTNLHNKQVRRPHLRKTSTTSPGRMALAASKKHASGRNVAKILTEPHSKQSEPNIPSKKALRDGIKSLHNSQNLSKHSSNRKLVSREKTKDSLLKPRISGFNNYLSNKLGMTVDPTKSLSVAGLQEALDRSLDSLLSVTLKPLYKPFLLSLTERHREALDAFFKLPLMYCNDPWVLAGVGKCYTELANHGLADLYFARAFRPLPAPLTCFEDSEPTGLCTRDKQFLREDAPERTFTRVEGVEFYSSCLWHLKKQQELCLLAHDCLEHHFFRPETWIVLANTYSLNQDHDAALQFLSRALKIDPDNAYAYCLSGHEYACKENFDKAAHCYKNAINIYPRNVRAYWGLGNLSIKTEKFDTAIDYFMKALKINSRCSTFYTQIGLAFLNKNNLELALSYMKRGEEISPDDPFNRYNKAYVR